MLRSELEFELPEDRIAQQPAVPRDHARLWVERLGEGRVASCQVRELAQFLRAGDLLVFNDTKVLPARVWAQRPTGGRLELLFLEPLPGGHTWLAMVRPAKKPRPGEVLRVAGSIQVRMVERKLDENGQPGALWAVQLLDSSRPETPVEELLEQAGEMPLPPYIHRDQGGAVQDREQYQTLFADRPGAVAAPTAGLHFTKELLDSLRAARIATTRITLHVGMGTFLPIQTDEVEQHRMHSERFHVSPEAAQAIADCRARGGRIIAVGTTSARALEAAAQDGTLHSGFGRTELYIRPGYRFRVVQGLLTNFHLPGSTLLLLVGALVGLPRLLSIYKQAIEEEFRFYSYGDAMLILPGESDNSVE